MKKNYSFLKGLKKGVISLVLFGIPFVLTNYPEVTNLTIGAVLVFARNFVVENYIR